MITKEQLAVARAAECLQQDIEQLGRFIAICQRDETVIMSMKVDRVDTSEFRHSMNKDDHLRLRILAEMLSTHKALVNKLANMEMPPENPNA